MLFLQKKISLHQPTNLKVTTLPDPRLIGKVTYLIRIILFIHLHHLPRVPQPLSLPPHLNLITNTYEDGTVWSAGVRTVSGGAGVLGLASGGAGPSGLASGGARPSGLASGGAGLADLGGGGAGLAGLGGGGAGLVRGCRGSFSLAGLT